MRLVQFILPSAGGRQFKITPNDLIVVNQIEADIGDEIFLEKVKFSLPILEWSIW
jgi:ribosomal protein L21